MHPDYQIPSVRFFRNISRVEAFSFLFLLGVAMPLKYAAGIPEAVEYAGWAHGVLFITYIISLFVVQSHVKWPFKTFCFAGFASVIPFGPFLFDKKVLNKVD